MQFRRFSLIFILVVIGFGGGLCGLRGIAVSAESSSDRGIVLSLSAVGLLVAVGCGSRSER